MGMACAHRPWRLDQSLVIGCDVYWETKREMLQREESVRNVLLAEAETREAMYISKLSSAMMELRAAQRLLSVPTEGQRNRP